MSDAAKKPNPYSEENHTMLIQLRDSVGTLSSTVSTFIEAQGEENRRLHGRIDSQGESTARAVNSIKDTIAERSRVTPALVAMILSSVAIVGGAGTAYIGLQTTPLHGEIAAVSGDLRTMETQRLIMRQDLVALQIKTAAEDAKQQEADRWEEKLLDEVRQRK